MEVLLLAIYAFCVWLIFFKFKLLPWTTTAAVIVVTIPIFALVIGWPILARGVLRATSEIVASWIGDPCTHDVGTRYRSWTSRSLM